MEQQAGFSLVEFIIVVVIVGIVAVATGPMLFNASKSANTQ